MLVLDLRRESHWNPWCSRSIGPNPGIGAIVSPELEGTFREVQTDDERADEHQSYVILLMQILADGEPLPALSDVLEETVRDPTWYQGVRSAALDVLTAYHTRTSAPLQVLRCHVKRRPPCRSTREAPRRSAFAIRDRQP